MKITTRKFSLAMLATAVTLIAGAGPAWSQDGDIARLEARVAELEALVHQLIEERGTTAAVMPAPAPEPAPAAEAESGASSSYKFGGYVKLDGIWSDYGAGDLAPGSLGSQFYVPGTIPVGDSSASEGPDADFQARETRIFFRSDHVTDAGNKFGTYIEMDFFVNPDGNERVSNSYNSRLRHAFLKYNNWTFGQTWSTFQDVGALPENLDFIGPSEGTTFIRQAQIRYTSGPWEFAVENPETTITPFGGGARIVTDDGAIPDLVGRYTFTLDDGYVKAAALFRSLDYDIAGESDSETAFGFSLSGKHSIGRDDIRWMATYGSGTGRYLGLNTANGAVLDAAGNLEAIDEFGGFVSLRHFWSDQWRSNFTASYLSIDNDLLLTGLGVTKDVYSLHANLLYEPVPKLLVGGEIIYAEREVESGLDGDMTRFMLSAKYGF